MNKLAATAYLTVTVIGCGFFIAEARPIYGQREKKDCGYCHGRAQGGGARSFRGQFYGANGLSFANFDEKRESAIAGVTPDAEAGNSMPSVAYAGNFAGPATQQIQLASLKGPVLLVFIDKASEPAKAAIKNLGDLAKAYGQNVAVFGIAKTDTANALKLTTDLGSRLRIFPDVDGAAIKKFSVTNGFDMAVVAKMGDPVKSFEGFSKANLEAAIKVLTESQSIAEPKTFDATKVSEKPFRGEKL